ncbi:MAG: hypothetical protein M1823_001875 [Watsoniomyces obsoletus]|nr:MAG: hypothetical protein M1823_001875 [Watsoniomyces obsoletus]
MPPKKTEPPKAAKKAVEDKTFGMKNKKGSTAKKQIAQLQAAASSSKTPDQKRKDAEKAQREAEKKASEIAKREAAELFKPVQVQKVPFGVDPKTVVCQFYKSGNCEKGKKCKFSHDLSIERKAEKKNLYQDMRDGDDNDDETNGTNGGTTNGNGGTNEKEEGMDDWDEEKLRKVVLSKHGKNPKTTTDKVCKYFIDAVENGKYGWFWQCPNGGDKCMYRHSLPQGFILKTKEQRAAEKALQDKSPLATLTLEDFLEASRAKLTGALTPVTPETFAKWKQNRLDKKAAEEEARKARDATGREMFEKGDWMKFDDDDDGSGSDDDDSGEEEEGSGEGDEEEGGLNDMDALRRETEEIREREERERIRDMEMGIQRGVGVGGGGEMNGVGVH